MSKRGRRSSSTSHLPISHCSGSFSNTELRANSPNNSSFENWTHLQSKTTPKPHCKFSWRKIVDERWSAVRYMSSLWHHCLWLSLSEWQRQQTPPSLPSPVWSSHHVPSPDPLLTLPLIASFNQLVPQRWAKEMLLLEALQGKVSEWLHPLPSLQGSMKRVQILCFIPP